MEAVQVESDEYEAWDACGYAVRLFAELKGESKPYREKEPLLRRFAPRFIWEMSRAFAED